MNKPIAILAPRGRDAVVIAHVLERASIATRICTDIAEVVAGLDECAAVVATEESLVCDEIDGVLAWVERQKPWSDLAFIVLAAKAMQHRPAGHRKMLEALGNAVLLKRPLNADSLVSAAGVALRARRRQIALRDLTDTLETRVVERTQALAESEERFRATVEGFPECLFVVRVGDARVGDGGLFLLESFNPAAERVSGLLSADVRGQTLERLIPEEAKAEIMARLRACVEQRKSLTFPDPVLRGETGRNFETTITPMPDPTGRITRLLCVSRDMTERNKLEDRLRAAQKLEAVGQLTGGVAHDFNNLLQVVISGLTLLERTEDPGRRVQLLDSVRRAAQRGGELIKRLLTVARRQALRPEPINPGAWVRDAADTLLARTLRGDITVVVDIAEALPAIEADASELELAVLNLAVNARDAMPAGGTLTLSADLVDVDEMTDPDELSGQFVRLQVSDTGLGMTPELQAKVFEPFFTTKEIGKGTGLGLAQVYGFVRQSGGGVRLRSAPGRGTSVSLLLPIARDAPAPPVVDRGREQPGQAERAAILVCEDDDEVAALVVDMLHQLGHVPTRVSTAAAALGALMDGRRVDLLFTDVMMPGGMDGLALAREAARRRPGLTVLLTTGYNGDPGAEPLGTPVLRKPYTLDEFAHALSRVLVPVA